MRTSKLVSFVFVGLLGCKSTEPGATAAGPPTLVSAYLALGQQLAADSTTGAGQQATDLLAAAERLGGQPGVSGVVEAAQGLPTELEPARARYRALSQGVLEYLDAHPDERRGLILAYCPMTFDNHGAHWVQREGELRNPYEGSRMLTCGAKLSWEEGPEHRARWKAAQADAPAAGPG